MNVRDNSPAPSDDVDAMDPGPSTARVEGLLAAVVAACECMVQHTDLLGGLQAAVEQLGRLSGHDRAYVWELTEEQTVCVCIAEWDAPGIARISDMAGTNSFAVADFMEVWTPLLANQSYQSVTPAKTGANAWLNEAVTNRSDVMMPIFVGDICWGCIGFDNCTEERRYSDAEVHALRGAASAVAAAVKRDAAVAARENERQRYESLLRAVAEASQHLLALDDLPQALASALDALRLHAGVDRVFLNRYASDEQATYSWLESHRADLPAFVAGFGPGPWPDDAFPEVAYPLREGRVYRSTADMRTGANASANRVTGSLSDLIVPIMVDGHYRACLGFDDNTLARTWSDAEVAVLQSAAAAIGAALARNEATQAVLAAREARIDAERSRAEESTLLASLLGQVANRSRSLIDATPHRFEAALHGWLGSLGRSTQAQRCTFYDIAPYPVNGQVTLRMLSEWVRDGVAGSQPCSFDVPYVIDPRGAEPLFDRVTSGEPISVHAQDTEGPVREFLESQGNQTVLVVPIFVGATQWGCLSFDYAFRREASAAEWAVLQTAADTLASVLKRNEVQVELFAEREQRIAVEQARADEAARHAARIERHSRLLAAVAASAEELLACADPADCMQAVLTRIGEVTHAERVCLARLDWTPQDPALHGWQEIAHEWTRPGLARQMDGPLRRFAMQRGDATWDAVLAQFATERRILVNIDSLDEPFRSEQQALDVVWNLCCPVLLEGQVWGVVGMDFATAFDNYDEADLAALQTVATTIADAQLRRRLEQRALATERARVAEAQALNRLLESVVQSSRELLDAPDLQQGLQEWLQVLALAVDADLAILGSLAPAVEGPALADWQVYWAKSVRENYQTPRVPVTTDFIDWHARLQRGETVWAHRDELLDPASVAFWQETHCWTNLLVPIRGASGTLGFLCFDWREKREWQPAFGTVLRTAADSVAGAIQRHEATQALLAERERRIKEEQGRVADLSRANLALRASLGALAETASAEGFLSQTLSQIAEQSGSRSAFLLRKSATSGMFQLVGHVDGGPFRREALPHHPQRFKTGYQLDPAVEQRLGAHGRLLWQPIDAQAAAAAVAADHAGIEPCDMMRWHAEQGHAAHALHALAVGQRTVGLVGLTFDTAEPLSAAQEELIHALCQPMTLALELDRLARAALRSGEHAAVLTERNRLAREIHDGIAQSFLAIQMQIDSLEGPTQHLAPVARAMNLARHGLTEARRAVSALRPHELLNRELPSGLRHLLAQMTAGSGLLPHVESPEQWPCLPPEVEDQLFRIAQEAASNVIKHARARQLRVELSQAAGVATMLIADDGVGFDTAKLPAGQGFGLESMQQRAQLIGARIQWLSQPGDGTQVLVTWGESAAPLLDPAPWDSA